MIAAINGTIAMRSPVVLLLSRVSAWPMRSHGPVISTSVNATSACSPVSPNPATSMTDIRYGLPASSDVTIELFDVTGRRVFVDRVNDVASGWQSYRLDVAGGKPALRTGIYFVRVTALGVRRESRMVVLR